MGARWMVPAAVGLAIAAVGAALTVRPFTSLSVLVLLVAVALVATGAGVVVEARRTGDRAGLAVGGLWVLAGVVAVAWPSITTRGVALVVGVTMVLGGALDVVAGLRATVASRLASVIGGLASVVFGVLALAWPDVTLLVVAVVFGARTVLFGLRLAWTAFRDRDGRAPADDSAAPGLLRRAGHLAGVSVALVVALLLAGLSVQLNRTTASVDAFYDTPDDLPGEPGRLLRAERFERGMPEGAVAYRILYTTTRDEGQPAVASGLVVAPADASGPLPVIAWAHGTTGFARHCAPTVVRAGSRPVRSSPSTACWRRGGPWWPPTTSAWGPRGPIPT